MSRRADLQNLITGHQRRLQKLKEQQALKGGNTPAEVLIEIEDIEARLTKLQAELEALPEIIRQNPYRGLSAFREEDADVFFGREAFTAQMVESVKQKSLVTVLGPSGSGKSSVLYAGLIPVLRNDDSQWLIASFRPGNHPFQALAASLLPLYETDLDKTDRMVKIPKLATHLRQGDLPLSDVVSHIFEAQPQARRFLLIADQFEELYTPTQEAEFPLQFLDLLLAPINMNAKAASMGLQLVLVLRADFLGQALLYAPFSQALQDTIELLGPMNMDELRMAIEKPAHLRGVTFEPGLVVRILEGVRNEPGNLALLEFALTQLWAQQKQAKLTHHGYETIGRVEGALSRHADEVFEDLSESEQERARQVFIHLVQPGEGTEDTRRLATKAELGETSWSLVQRLADERLLVTDQNPDEQETVEVVHEILIRGWDRLRNWIDTDRTFLLWQKRLRFALDQWQANQHDEGALWRGILLTEAEDWLARRAHDLGQAERDFIQASVALREREQQREEEARYNRLVLEIISDGAQRRDLSGTRLSEARLGGANLSGADLHQADLSRAYLSKALLSEADLHEADLSQADLSEADLYGANLSQANLHGANLSQTNLHQVTLSGAAIDDNTQLPDKWRLVWKIVNQGAKGRDLRGTNLRGANLNEADLQGANLSQVNLVKANLSRGILSKANLSEANLSEANLHEANLSEANLSEANLHEANLSGADLRWANLEETNLRGADLSGAYLGEAHLRGVILIFANLSGAGLNEANLSQADLSGANLSEANLSEANLRGTNLSGADLSRTNFSRAEYSFHTNWPDDFYPEAAGAILV